VGKYVKFQDLEDMDGFPPAAGKRICRPWHHHRILKNKATFIIRPSRMDDMDDEPPF
jgi:replicative DNA helicase